MTSPSFQVSPGDIRSFGLFMDSIQNDIAAMRDQLTGLLDAPDFGEYDLSADALKRYNAATTNQRDVAAYVAGRGDLLVTGTAKLAARYADTEQLNAAGTATVTSMLSEGGL